MLVKKKILIAVAAISILGVLLFLCQIKKEEPLETPIPATHKTVSVTGIKKETKTYDTETANTKATEDWKKLIFGEEKESVVSTDIRILGLKEREKEKMNLKEAAFVLQAAAFLDAEGVEADFIEFVEEVACSPNTAITYKTLVDGRADLYLYVMTYPKIEGKYIFTLQDVTIKEETLQEVKESEPYVLYQQIPVAEEKKNERKSTYDAAKLSVTDIPKTLLNYVDNRYELQYHLYDYLYKNEKKHVTSASVTDFAIDGEKREAAITFLLSDGSTIRGVYEKDKNRYRFGS